MEYKEGMKFICIKDSHWFFVGNMAKIIEVDLDANTVILSNGSDDTYYGSEWFDINGSDVLNNNLEDFFKKAGNDNGV